ncbi:hypothetical protein OF83DRAFT_375063 [Amylostereum chailletii]|nr:hypothetical protein OF83DRAFT_375063 [Amylostereum chailletii]
MAFVECFVEYLHNFGGTMQSTFTRMVAGPCWKLVGGCCQTRLRASNGTRRFLCDDDVLHAPARTLRALVDVSLVRLVRLHGLLSGRPTRYALRRSWLTITQRLDETRFTDTWPSFSRLARPGTYKSSKLPSWPHRHTLVVAHSSSLSGWVCSREEEAFVCEFARASRENISICSVEFMFIYPRIHSGSFEPRSREPQRGDGLRIWGAPSLNICASSFANDTPLADQVQSKRTPAIDAP